MGDFFVAAFVTVESVRVGEVFFEDGFDELGGHADAPGHEFDVFEAGFCLVIEIEEAAVAEVFGF